LILCGCWGFWELKPNGLKLSTKVYPSLPLFYTSPMPPKQRAKPIPMMIGVRHAIRRL